MEQEKDEVYNDGEKNTTATGTELPNADGSVSDEDVQAITEENQDRPTGQDHSTEDIANREPTEGVGAIQDNSLIRDDVADIEE